MKNTPMIPDSYASWYHCITVECEIQMTSAYVQERLAILRNPKEYQTERFTELYGIHHLQRVIGWFERAEQEQSPSRKL
ncbi:hypothetical protein BVH03_15320 [Pseudomonas sp. PA15(2017)]|uniref:hypothetical protein n=1 Tax=Pseudomonas sp. PA15(2017) TaxID=1932111 RepID=UPI00095E386B|nr:hypothetical protein [Pseudomonas sp. PA15(2017)]OLU26964.1 hypothetical protein BVH03_15320 [Pseudomonas sp. PA15(2017)]